ncbi:serine hydrolase domain-containing protein [Hymenobacter sp. DG25A]|uniref:serine hydrolase domain-containing protein n=1 Tax=Hymenobacter sp. DG25A TaxID=1385663 RepID=UPI0009E7C712|nr:serine hydrolase domain-containing protein [Hymenobacter sp. DG25A]
MPSRIYLILLLLLLSSLTATAQQKELAALLKQKQVTGIQLVYTNNNHVKNYALGYQHADTRRALTARTTMQAASLGKVVLAYVALRLHDRGLLALDKPLLSYYPYPRLQNEPRADKITARMVLTHSSGLPNWAENPLAESWKTSALHLKYAPDSCWNYSGDGFVLLQKTLEHITDRSWEQLAREEVFIPLKMPNSSYVWQPRFAINAATGHNKAGKPTEIRRFTEPNAGFSLLTTATDYNQFVQALLAGTGLQPATHQFLLQPASAANRCGATLTPTDADIAWAYGLGLANTTHGPALWHWGSNDDFEGFFMVFPDRKETLLFLTNSGNGLKIADDVLRLFCGPGNYKALQWLAEEK